MQRVLSRPSRAVLPETNSSKIMTDWQKQYAAGQTPWDRGAPAPALLHYLSTNPVTGRVLVPGCGTGHDVKALALAGTAEVTGLDLAPLAVERARRLVAGTPRTEVLLGDLFTLCHTPELAGHFDLVWEHTCYCAIPPARREDYVAAVASALKPGGHLLGVFYLNPWEEHEDQTQGPPFGTGLDELRHMMEKRFRLVQTWQPDVAYPGREGREWCGLFEKKD